VTDLVDTWEYCKSDRVKKLNKSLELVKPRPLDDGVPREIEVMYEDHPEPPAVMFPVAHTLLQELSTFSVIAILFNPIKPALLKSLDTNGDRARKGSVIPLNVK
jgi:hypothetical protein